MNEFLNKDESLADLKKINQIQITLVEKFYGFASDEVVMEWIKLYSRAFREAVTQHPDLLSRFDAEPDAVLEEIGHLLYDKNPHN